MSNETNAPSSPDSLKSGIRGRVEGVTRVGPRAMLLGFLVLVTLMAGILYGLTRTPKSQAQQLNTGTVVARPQPTTGANWAKDVPIVDSPPAETPPPAVLLPPSPPPLPHDPSFDAPVVVQRNMPENSGPSPAVLAAQRRADAEHQRRIDEEKARAEALKRAYEAPILTGNGGGNTAAAPVPAAPASAAPPTAANSPNPALAYLAGPTGQYSNATSALPGNAAHNDTLPAARYAPSTIFELTAGSVVPASLVTGIDSEQPGLVTGQVREDVFDAKTGRYLLIPRGSRLVGVYKSDVAYGKSRVTVAWQRLIFPDTSSIDLLAMTGADVQGGGGLGGKVDNHTGQLITATLLSSVLAAGVALSQPRTQTVASTADGTVAIPSAGQQAAQGVGAQLADVGQGLIQKNLNIPPVVHVPKGYPFIVVVDRDIVFPGPYERGS